MVARGSAKYWGAAAVVLGWLGAASLLFMGFYLFTVYRAFSAFPSMERLSLNVYFSVTLIIVSALAVIWGSSILFKNKWLKGGITNLLTGALAPIPSSTYFAYFSEPKLLEGFGVLGFLLRTAAIMSGVIGIALSSLQRQTRHVCAYEEGLMEKKAW